MVAFVTSSDERREVIDEEFGLTVGEVEWAITHEEAHRLADVIARRTMIGLENDLGQRVVEPVAAICARVLEWSDDRRDAEIAAYHHYLTRFIPQKETA